MNTTARIKLIPLVLCLAHMAADAQEADPLETALARPVTLQFLETPISAVLAYLQDTYAVPVVMDPDSGDDSVTIKLGATTLGDALDVILGQVEMAYVREDGVLYVADRQQIEGRRAAVRAYVVGDLISPVEDFPGRWGSGFELSRDEEPGGFGITMADEGIDMIDIDMLIDLITSRIDPSSWEEEYASITELAGLIVVRQKPEVHEGITALLAKLREGAGALVWVEARYYAVPRAQLADVLRDSELLDAAGRLRLHQAGRLLHGVSTTGFNSQRFQAHTGGCIQYVRDYDVEIAQSASCFDPIVGTVLTGMQLDVRPVLGPDDRYVTVQLRVNLTSADSEIERSDVTHAATVASANSDKDASLWVNGQAVMGLGSVVQKPGLHLDAVRTYTRIPIGQGRVFLRSSELVESGEIAVLVVTPRLVR